MEPNKIIELAISIGRAIKEIESITGKSVRVFRYDPNRDSETNVGIHVIFEDGSPIGQESWKVARSTFTPHAKER